MPDHAIDPPTARLALAAHWALGGIAIGTLDLAYAWTFWHPHGVRLVRILQSISAGLLGGASFDGGLATAALGAGLHYFIATMFVVAYFLASVRLPALRRHPVACGLAYGVLLYVAMNFVVLPLSAAGLPDFGNVAWVASSVAMHAVFGLMCGLFVRWSATRSRSDQRGTTLFPGQRESRPG